MRRARRRWANGLIVLVGIVVFQFVLYGPALLGRKLLLPLDLLAQPQVYLPAGAAPRHSSAVLLDDITHWELARRFAAEEVRAGRMPFWDPYSYAGAPFADFGKYSPFMLVRYAFPSPVTVAWVQLLKAIVAGVGAYLFLRWVVGLRFWFAALGAWLYPLTGFLVLWLHDPISEVVVWYPLLLVAIDRAVRRPAGWGMVAVALLTCIVLLCGHVDVAGQVLLASAAFAGWCLWRRSRWRLSGRLVRGGGAVLAGAILGIMLAGPYLFPLADYVGTSQRLTQRQSGHEERPPGHLSDLPQVAFAGWFGGHQPDAVYFADTPTTLTESAAGASVGVLALLAAAPLAWLDRRRRGVIIFLAVSAALGLLWVLGIPGAVALLRLPGLNMMSHNRLTFMTSFAVLALAMIGLHHAWRQGIAWQRWFVVPAALLLLLGGGALARALVPPEALTNALREVAHPKPALQSATDTYLWCAGLCLVGFAGWISLSFGAGRAWSVVLAVLMAGELVVFAAGHTPECAPALYYPPLPALQAIARAGDGRALCVDCLPANLHLSQGLREVRGYDAIDPRPILDVLDLARDPHDHSPPYARTQTYRPRLGLRDGDVALSPVLDMLNVRYLVFPVHLALAQKPRWSGDGYFVYVNPRAVARASVPSHVRRVFNEGEARRGIADAVFAPHQTALVDSPVSLPSECLGTARIVSEVPCEIAIAADMDTAGLLVLADQWAAGWSAEIDGQPADVLRTDYALKGVLVPAGKHTVIFRYQPPGLIAGLICFGTAIVVLLVLAVRFHGTRKRTLAETSAVHQNGLELAVAKHAGRVG